MEENIPKEYLEKVRIEVLLYINDRISDELVDAERSGDYTDVEETKDTKKQIQEAKDLSTLIQIVNDLCWDISGLVHLLLNAALNREVNIEVPSGWCT